MKRLALGLTLAALLAVGIGLGTAVVRFSGPSTSAAIPGEDAVQRAMRSGKLVVAEFGANACASCREMKLVLAQLRRTHGERIEVVEIDLLKEPDYPARYRIRLMPTQVFFDTRGREIGRHMGTISADEIVALLESATK